MAKREDNLRPIKKGQLSKDEAKRRARTGGIKSAEVRRQKKTMREMLDYLLEKEITTEDGTSATTLEAISIALLKKAISGDVKAFEVLRDTIGQKVSDKHEILAGLEVQKVFVTPEEKNKALEHINNVIKEQPE